MHMKRSYTLLSLFVLFSGWAASAQNRFDHWQDTKEYEYREFNGMNISPLIHLSCEILREVVYIEKTISWRVINLSTEPVNIEIQVQYIRSCGGVPVNGPAIKNKKPLLPGVENCLKDDIEGTDPSTLGRGFRKRLSGCEDNIELSDIKILSCKVTPVTKDSTLSTGDPLPDPEKLKTLRDFSFEKYKSESFAVIRDLNNKIKILCEANTSESQTNRIISESVLLFINEEAAVEVSSVASGVKKQFRIREYLRRISQLPYTRVKIEWTKMQIVTDFVLQPDGSYSAVAQFEQKFEGIRDEQVIYKDVTEKKVTVHLRPRKKMAPDNPEVIYDVFLGDIGVLQTRKG